jgi:hypothetical protein
LIFAIGTLVISQLSTHYPIDSNNPSLFIVCLV